MPSSPSIHWRRKRRNTDRMAELQAAPASRSLLAGVMEVQHTVMAFADACSISIGEQRCRAVRQWSE
jgi:hypothetical protein